MSPDYPPQTIVDSPWKEGEYLLVLVKQPRLSLSATLLANWPCHFWIISSPFLFSLFPPLLLSLPCFSSPFSLFFYFVKRISIRGHKRDARIEGTFCGNSPLTGAWTAVGESDPRGPGKGRSGSASSLCRKPLFLGTISRWSTVNLIL